MIAMQGGGFKVVAPSVTISVLVSLAFLATGTSIEAVLADVRVAAAEVVNATTSGGDVDSAAITSAVESTPGVLAVLGCIVGDKPENSGPFFDVPAAVAIAAVRITP